MFAFRPWKIIVCVLVAAVGTIMISQSHPDENIPLPNGIDHILYASSSLQQGMDEIEVLLGVRPVPGGRHPQYGTHNALLSLGPGVYLEVIARDPDLPAPERGALIDIPQGENSRLFTFAFRAENIQQTADALRGSGIELGPIESGNRIRPDGSKISWQLTDPYAMPLDGAVPFLIDWGTTPHPSLAVPVAGELVELIIEYPQPDSVRAALSALGADVKVVGGNQVRIFAIIQTETGQKTLD